MICGHLGFYNLFGSRTHVRFAFSTHAAAGGNVAPNSAFEAADLRIYKATDGAALSATQRSSSSGITMTSPFDSLTGVHSVDIDLTDDTDTGFYDDACYYEVWLCPDETVDSQTITGVCLCSFDIARVQADVRQYAGVDGEFNNGLPSVNTTFWNGVGVTSTTVRANLINIAGSAVNTSSAQLGVNVVNAAGTAWASGAITASAIASDAITAAKIADNAIDAGAIASDAITSAKIADGAITAAKIATGAIDADAVAADAVTEIQSGLATAAALATAQADLDILTGADGATLATAQANYAPLKPTTAGRTLDVTAGGNAGVDWANVESPTTTLNLSGTTVKTATDVEADTQDIQSRIPAALVNSRMDCTIDGTGMESGALAAILASGDVDGYTIEQTLKLCLSALAAKLSGAATATVTIRAADDSKDRITATVDASGNRTAVTLDAAG